MDILLRAQKIEPNNPKLLNNLASLHYLREEYEKALGYYLSALQINPSDHLILNSIGGVYEKLG